MQRRGPGIPLRVSVEWLWGGYGENHTIERSPIDNRMTQSSKVSERSPQRSLSSRSQKPRRGRFS